MMTLLERCLELSYKERLSLCASLQDSILQEKRDGRNPNANRGQQLMEYMEEVIGEPVPVNSRDAHYVWARTMVAYQLTQEGFTTIETGRMIGKDHSTIIHMKQKMQDALAFQNAYRDIIRIWERFQNKIENEVYKGTTEDPICLGGKLPDCNEGKMGEESGEIRTPGDL